MIQKIALVAIVLAAFVGGGRHADAQPTPQPGFAPGEPTPAPPPSDGTVKNSGCNDVVKATLLKWFSTADEPLTGMQCQASPEAAPTEGKPTATVTNWIVQVGWDKSASPAERGGRIQLRVLADGTVESVACPPPVQKAVITRFGPTPRSLDGGPPPALRCMPDSGRTLHVDVPAKAVARIKVDGTFVGMVAGNDDIHESGSALMALLFWAFAAATIGGALFVITRRNLIAAVMGMVGSFLGIAAIYMMLYAQFLAVIQMLVYAGAIMVLFVFVIMILNRPEDEPIAPTGRAGQTLGIIAIVYLVYRLAMILIHVRAPNGEASLAAPAPLPVPAPGTGVHEWGTLKAVGTDLFGNGLFPFETISILLLIAVVGAIAIARPLKDDEP